MSKVQTNHRGSNKAEFLVAVTLHEDGRLIEISAGNYFQYDMKNFQQIL